MSFSSKKENESVEASFFLTRFNAWYQADYQAVPNTNELRENTEVDIFAVSSSGQHPELRLQIITRDARLRQEEGKILSEARRTNMRFTSGHLIDIDICQWVQEAIQKKKYSPETIQSLVLLITTDIGPLLNEKFAKRSFAKLQSNGYKAIYYVHLPNHLGNSSHSHKGQIVSIKGIKGDNGIPF